MALGIPSIRRIIRPQRVGDAGEWRPGRMPLLAPLFTGAPGGEPHEDGPPVEPIGPDRRGEVRPDGTPDRRGADGPNGGELGGRPIPLRGDRCEGLWKGQRGAMSPSIVPERIVRKPSGNMSGGPGPFHGPVNPIQTPAGNRRIVPVHERGQGSAKARGGGRGGFSFGVDGLQRPEGERAIADRECFGEIGRRGPCRPRKSPRTRCGP